MVSRELEMGLSHVTSNYKHVNLHVTSHTKSCEPNVEIVPYDWTVLS